MAGYKGIDIPNIDTSKLSNTDYVKQIAGSLAILDENLRYMFSNLDDENLSTQYIENITNVTSSVEPIQSISLTDTTMTVVTETKTTTYSLTKNSNGLITQLSSGDNVINIFYS